MTSEIASAAAINPVEQSRPFLEWLSNWNASLATLDLSGYMGSKGVGPAQVAAISADLVNGFCYEGPLASPRITGIVQPSAALFTRAYELGVRNFALAQEYHTHDAPEFEQFGTHCVRSTAESETVSTLANLPFAGLFAVIRKNSLHPALHTEFDRWLAQRREVNTFIAVGDCTDLCLYQLVMYLKLEANAAGRRVDVLVPANCVQTYDLPVDAARSIGAMPHDGNLLHALFLYHMALNGALVVKSIN